MFNRHKFQKVSMSEFLIILFYLLKYSKWKFEANLANEKIIIPRKVRDNGEIQH